MKIADFRTLSLDEQVTELAKNAVRISEIHRKNEEHYLYQIHSFYVEFSFLNDAIKQEIKIFEDTKDLEAHLENMDINIGL